MVLQHQLPVAHDQHIVLETGRVYPMLFLGSIAYKNLLVIGVKEKSLATLFLLSSGNVGCIAAEDGFLGRVEDDCCWKGLLQVVRQVLAVLIALENQLGPQQLPLGKGLNLLEDKGKGVWMCSLGVGDKFVKIDFLSLHFLKLYFNLVTLGF